MHVVVPAAFFAGVLAFSSAAGASNWRREHAPPPEAALIIQQTLRAAQQRDYVRLRGLMLREFISGFVESGDADSAITTWKEQPTLLRELVRVLKKGCSISRKSADRVDCDGRGGMDHRAGFALTQEGWRMSYFVAGD